MEKELKRSLTRTFLIYLALYFALFLLFYIPNYLIEDYAYIVGNFEYVRHFFAMLLEFLLGASGAVVLFSVLIRHGGVTTSRAIWGAATVASARVIYSLPYYYLYFLSLGYDSIDGIPLYTLSALIAVILEWVKTLGLFAAVYFVARRGVMGELIKTLPVSHRKKPTEKERRALHTAADLALSERLVTKNPVNLDIPVTLGVFLASAGQFILSLVLEIKNAADYLTEYAGNYRTDEIVYMTVSFIFLVAELIISHLLCHYVKNRLAGGLKTETET